MSKEEKGGSCKYCHLNDHLIDKCPTIICKHCKAIGHPNWLCKSNPNAENAKSPVSPNLRNKKSIYAFDSTNSLSKNNKLSKNDLNKEEDNVVLKSKDEVKKNYIGFKDDFKQKVIETIKIETPIINLQYYQKMLNSKWGDLIEIF